VSADNAIELTAVSLDYGDYDTKKTVLGDVTINIPHGHIVGIVGRSGAGKSSLLRLMAGLHTPTSGSIKVFGENITSPPPRLGYVVQDYSTSLYPWLRVRSNILLAMGKVPGSRQSKRHTVSDLLNTVGLAGEDMKYPWQLSGGMQQRVAIARALAGNPRLLLMDEPFASVDAQVRLELEDLVRSLVKQKQITTVFVTHDLDEAVYLSDRILVVAGNPAHIVHDVAVELGDQRHQLHTRAMPEFHEYRRQLFQALESEKLDGPNLVIANASEPSAGKQRNRIPGKGSRQ
jgi:NitT/TauT family transport system ATP-binding protein